MISLACENSYMTHPLLLTIEDHVTQGHINFHHSCSLTELPLKFVFGSDRCKVRFITVRNAWLCHYKLLNGTCPNSIKVKPACHLGTTVAVKEKICIAAF